MRIGDELPSRVAAVETIEEKSMRHTQRDRDAHQVGLERALEDVRQVGIEASELLRAEGLKPSKIVYVPRDAPSYPLFGYAFSRVKGGCGWHVVRGVVVGTDGRLWARKPVSDPTPQKDLDAWKLEVEPPHEPLHLPRPVKYDGISLHSVRWLSESEYVKVDFIDRLLDGYARLLLLHHRRRS